MHYCHSSSLSQNTVSLYLHPQRIWTRSGWVVWKVSNGEYFLMFLLGCYCPFLPYRFDFLTDGEIPWISPSKLHYCSTTRDGKYTNLNIISGTEMLCCVAVQVKEFPGERCRDGNFCMIQVKFVPPSERISERMPWRWQLLYDTGQIRTTCNLEYTLWRLEPILQVVPGSCARRGGGNWLLLVTGLDDDLFHR
jgi:hypothetical protein